MDAPAITGVGEAESLRQAQGMPIHPPSRGPVRFGRFAEYLRKAGEGFVHFCLDPRIRGLFDLLFPTDAVPGVNTNLMARIADLTHCREASAPDVRAGQHSSIEACAQVIVSAERSGKRFAATAVGPEREEKACLGLVFLQ